MQQYHFIKLSARGKEENNDLQDENKKPNRSEGEKAVAPNAFANGKPKRIQAVASIVENGKPKRIEEVASIVANGKPKKIETVASAFANDKPNKMESGHREASVFDSRC